MWKELEQKEKEHRRAHRKEYACGIAWLERLGEGILDGIAHKNIKAFEVARAVLDHLESKIKDKNEGK